MSPPSCGRQRARTADVASFFADDESDVLDADFCEKMEVALEAGGVVTSAAVLEIQGSVRTMAFDPKGSPVVQHAMEVAGVQGQRKLAAELHGLAREAAKSPHSCKVLEKVVHCLGTEDAAFIAEELQGLQHELIQNMHMCSIVCRLLEHSGTDWRTVALVDEVLSEDVAGVSCHKFGHLLAASIVTNGIPRQVLQVVTALRSNPQRYARHRFACKVVEAALLTCPPHLCNSLAHDLMGQPGAVSSLACHNFGVQVVRALVQLPQHAKQVKHYLCKTSRRVLKDKYGNALMQDLGLIKAAVGGA